MRTSACLVQYLAVNGVFNRDGDCSLRDRARLKRDGTRVETRFRLSAKRTSPFKSAGTSVQSTAGSRGVRISVSNAGYTMFRGSVRVLATHSIRQFPLYFPSRASPCAITFQTQSTLTTTPLGCREFYEHRSIDSTVSDHDLNGCQ